MLALGGEPLDMYLRTIPDTSKTGAEGQTLYQQTEATEFYRTPKLRTEGLQSNIIEKLLSTGEDILGTMAKHAVKDTSPQRNIYLLDSNAAEMY